MSSLWCYWKASYVRLAQVVGWAVQARFRGMKIRGLTEPYIDTLTTLYEQHVPNELRKTKVPKIKPAELATVYRSLQKKPGSARTLHAFLGQIIKDVRLHSSTLARAFYLEGHAPLPARNDFRYYRSRQFPEKLFNDVFERLEGNQTSWVQASFIRLLFEFGAPADRLMKAEWDHIAEGRWYPWLKGERQFWWLHARIIDDITAKLLENLRIRGRQEFGDSVFLFPSRLSRTGHIRSFQNVWRPVAEECEVNSGDLTRLVRAYHGFEVSNRVGAPTKHYGGIVQGVFRGSE
jgi:hypothetical protein